MCANVSLKSAGVLTFDEPGLEFGYGQLLTDPRHGLSLFGPPDHSDSSGLSLGYVLVGTDVGIQEFGKWSKEMNRATTVVPHDNHRLWVPFPGYRESFGRPFPTRPIRTFTIDAESVNTASRRGDPHERAFQVVNLYLERLELTQKLDEQVGVGICVVPDEVWRNCRPLSRVAHATSPKMSGSLKAQLKAGQRDMFNDYDANQFWHSTDFRRQLKARAMQYNLPLQIVRESTLRLNDESDPGLRQLSPLSDRKWNLGVAHYYKCGGKPWRLTTARDGVCYVGIAFRRTDDARTACCAAQMFLSTGDGVVFLGEYGPWYSPESKQFCLPRHVARQLLTGVLQTYVEQEGKDMEEVFLHSRSTISAEEFAGYREACANHVDLVGIRVRGEGRRAVRLYREGKMPVLRGTFWKIDRRCGYLWCSGFKPDLGTYDGWEVPQPIRIDIQHGDAPIERVAQDILGLTKLNYNTCHVGDSEPVTIKYSDAVGEILISNPRVSTRRHNFKFYI